MIERPDPAPEYGYIDPDSLVNLVDVIHDNDPDAMVFCFRDWLKGGGLDLLREWTERA